MAHPNPYYEPNWKTFHRRRHAKLERARSDLRRLSEARDYGSEDYAAAKAEHRRRHEAFMLTYKMQHPTVQEYAAWVFWEFPVGMEAYGEAVPVPEVDFAAFRSIEEVDAAWARIDRAVTEAACEKQASLPIGQPKGLRVFSAPASLKLLRYWKHFEPSDLYPGGFARGPGVRTLITADQQEDGWHVCFMHDWNSPGMGVTNAIERLATALYREAAAGRWPPAKRRWSAWLAHRLVRPKPAVAPYPGRFHFYQHIPPKPEGGRETFDRVLLRFWQGEYRDPEWFGYKIIPEVIQSARLDCAVENSPLGRQVALLP